MAFSKSFIPYGCYWSTPFVRWQGTIAHLHPMRFCAEIAVGALKEKDISPEVFDALVLGTTVPSKHCFYGAPWMAGMIGAVGATGPMIGQACATSAKCVETAAREIEGGDTSVSLVVTCDKCSNGPHIYYPNPLGPGGTGDREDWVWDNFSHDPFAKNAMLETAENVAREENITKEEQDDLTVVRYNQYQKALENEREFQKKYMVAPIEVKDNSGRKVIGRLEGDEGVFPTNMEGLAKLRPVFKDKGTVSYGTQTFPADGNACMVLATRDKAQELSKNKDIAIQVLSYAQARAKKGFMAKAIVPAARRALEIAGVGIKDMKAIKAHTPFAVNDVYFCREFDLKFEGMNNYGCSLIYGHPQGPTGLRTMIELIEELVLLGGGYGLFDGCAAGDTGAAVVLKVDV
ncbi:MAG: thiolase family protein [Pseudomonadota bacterium]